jgi:hypothetical protein
MRKKVSCVVVIIMLIAMIGSAGVFAEPGKLFINEVMAVNGSTIRDGDIDDPKSGSKGGDYSDWIEIYNAGTQAIDLTGYTISDDGATWTFPQGMIPANGYLLVWASDKDKVAPDGQLHANFKITSLGETITLKMPNGTVVDSITTTYLEDDQSYGRKSDGSSEFSIFLKSTPGSANIYDPSLSAVIEPIFSHQGGFYTREFNLQLSTSESGVRIYYTANGSDPVPGTSGTLEYIEGINIKSRVGEPNDLSMIQNISADRSNPWRAPVGEVFKCSTIKAVAIRDDGAKSNIITHSYFVDPNMNTRYSFPVISIVTDRANFFDDSTGIYVSNNSEKRGSEWERPIHIEFFEKDGTLGFSQYAGVRIHGNYTRKYPQKSLRLYADKDYDAKDEFEYEIFPGLRKNGSGKKLKSFERLILRNSGNDWTGVMFRDAMMQSLVSHLKPETQAYRPSIVFLNGEYWGIHNIRERFDKKYLEDHYDLDDDKVVILDPKEQIEVQEGTEEDAEAYMNDIVNYLKSNDITQKSTYDYIKTKMDIENFIDYNVSQIYFGNTDWPHNNVSVWKYKTDDGQYHPEAPYGQDGRWRWIIKDTDFGFHMYDTAVTHDTLNYATTGSRSFFGNTEWAVLILKTLLQNNDFRNEFINRFADNLNTSFDPVRVNQIVDQFATSVEPEITEHTNRWPGYIKMVAENPRDFTFSQHIERIRNFATERTSNVRQHILNKFRTNGVAGTAKISLNTNATQGYIRINSIDIKETTPAVANPSSWTGVYFTGVPLTLKAIPEDGYAFERWEGVTGVSQTSDTITVILSADMNVSAVFRASGTIVTPTPNTGGICGDLNGDGSVNSTDYALLKRYILGLVQIPVEDIYTAADLNTDGIINSTDYTILKRYLLGIIKTLPY